MAAEMGRIGGRWEQEKSTVSQQAYRMGQDLYRGRELHSSPGPQGQKLSAKKQWPQASEIAPAECGGVMILRDGKLQQLPQRPEGFAGLLGASIRVFVHRRVVFVNSKWFSALYPLPAP